MYFTNKSSESRNNIERWVTATLILAIDELWLFRATLRLDLVEVSHMSIYRQVKLRRSQNFLKIAKFPRILKNRLNTSPRNFFLSFFLKNAYEYFPVSYFTESFLNVKEYPSKICNYHQKFYKQII